MESAGLLQNSQGFVNKLRLAESLQFIILTSIYLISSVIMQSYQRSGLPRSVLPVGLPVISLIGIYFFK